MSWVSKAVGSGIPGGFAGGLFGGGAGAVGGYLGTKKGPDASAMSSGTPLSGGGGGSGMIGYGPTDANGYASRISDIQQKINAGASQGTYGEGAIAIANQEFQNLQSDLNSGKLSQSDYVKIGDAIIPQMQTYIQSVGGKGSNAANAMRAAGGESFTNNFGKNYQIYKAGQDLLGRDLTQNDLASLTPYFSDINAGRAAVSQMAEQEKNSPANLAKKAPQYTDQINGVYQGLLNRGATKDEIDHFGGMIASGQLDPYALKQFVEATPEYQTQADTKFRGGLADELQGYDTKFFDKAKDSVISQFAKNGTMGSSGLDFALTDLMGKIADNRGQYLAGLSAQQYGGNKDAARQDYLGTQGQMLDNMSNQRNRSQGLQDFYLQRSTGQQDYQQQMTDMQNMMNGMPQQRKSGIGGAVGSLAGAGLGAFLGGPAGANLGASLGRSGGGLYDYLNY